MKCAWRAWMQPELCLTREIRPLVKATLQALGEAVAAHLSALHSKGCTHDAFLLHRFVKEATALLITVLVTFTPHALTADPNNALHAVARDAMQLHASA